MRNSAEIDLNKLGEESTEDDALFKSLRGFLIFGRFIGLLPYKGIFSHSSKNLSFSWLSFPSAISYVLFLVITFNTSLEFIQSATASKKNAYEIAQSIRNTLYYIWGSIIYLTFIIRANSFLNIFKVWRDCSIFYTKPDTKLKRDVVIISVLILASATLENATYYTGYVEDMLFAVNGHSVNSTLQSYYISSHPSWTKFIPYNAFLAVLAFVQHKFILFGWNYMDILIALLGRALYFKFKGLCDSAKETLVLPLKQKPRFTDNPKTTKIPDGQSWIQMTQDHSALCELIKAFENFLSPLIFMSYMINIYYVCMQLLDGLTVDLQKHSLSESIAKPWSFIHLIMRIYIISICLARVNVYAHQIRDLINECPSNCYNRDMSRLDKRVAGGHEIGLTGLGCFTVTKPFILGFIGVIFTFEIVLLQVIPDETQGQKCCCK